MCVCEDEDTTTNLRECLRCSVDVLAGVRIVRSHAIMKDVIDVRIVECHASINVVIGIRVVLCHPLVDFPLFWIFTSCPNSHRCHAVTIHHNFYLQLFCTRFAPRKYVI